MADTTPPPTVPPTEAVETPPEKSALEQLSDYIYGQRGADVLDRSIVKGELSLTIKRDHIVPFLTFLRDDDRTAFQQLMDVCGVDYPARGVDRFDVVYHLLSLSHNHRIRVKVATSEFIPVSSVAGLYPVATWFERETYDMFGIYFSDHPDLRRILTDYGFDGHPMRKDFPMTGFVEVHYDSEQRRVVYAPVQLTQDYRNFDALSPWEGMTDVQLPGDEKGTKPVRGWVPAVRDPHVNGGGSK